MRALKAMNPATGEEGEIIQTIEPYQVEEVMEEAWDAFEDWSSKSVQERVSTLRTLRIYISDHADEIAQSVSWSTGKPKIEALTNEVLVLLDWIHHTERTAVKELKTRKVKTPITLLGKKSYIAYEPRGVVLVISPWNYPFYLAMVPVLSALIAGNAVIIKPSEVTPAIGHLMERIFTAAGFPKGLVQVVQGDGAIGAALVAASPNYVFFTGSVATGKKIQVEAAKRLIPTTLELGGKDPMIVFEDAHLERTVRGAVWGSLANSGQVCMSIERIYVERPIYDKFIARLKRELESLKQNNREDTDLGSMTFAKQIDIVRGQIDDALEQGAVLEFGERPVEWKMKKSMHLRPIVLTHVRHSMRVMQEETFGPVLCIMPFDKEEEVIELANSTTYGLNASVWTNNLERGRRVANALQSGAVCINDVNVSIANPNLPFGGVKDSGIGRSHGSLGLQMFCHEKSIIEDPGRNKGELHWYPYVGKYPLFLRMIQGLYGRNRNYVQFIRAFLSLSKKSR
ncbi:aldehyde dehydrogenase family protein [Paenibacillus terrigena]|uniref:aldehyde dehydrogenase family protein n=1 Tax=Paenibacillus terrigena TaxID=369333 RepID=UPI00036C6771|nr:aldehyde dehydrogenase family protein [Paenibacillus terrigena]